MFNLLKKAVVWYCTETAKIYEEQHNFYPFLANNASRKLIFEDENQK